MVLKLTLQVPDKSSRRMSRLLRDAIDQAFVQHQKTALPRHFTTQAFVLYPGEYADSRGVDKYLAGKALQKKISNMSTSEREQFFSDKQEQQKDRKGNRKRNKNLPLVETGRLKSAVLEGAPLHRGPLRRRSLTLNVPLYTFFNPPGQIHKARAIQAIHPLEDLEFAEVVDKILETQLNKDK